ncbi:hypothetical protein SAMN02745244_00161 [Tessaracoccus bendigoensis DSM 12906]|uniref:Uncharacterized protein n=1 Tax=Tessaracoccus bendigoensis DSM 12906 TaxID=1123357 RepID=A0A1M6AEC5_9ACTN|nr:hypothetical protein [Tessaracoccus bendigoensis]SHI34648.1 hypothetical protein SAMN02745244_00161 [Tessaracoccus bendigoensis DSM 12906]
MKQKWLAYALVVLAALGALSVSLTGEDGFNVAPAVLGVVIGATLLFGRRPWWAWSAIGAAAATALVALLLRGSDGWYLLPSAFLAAVAGLFDLTAPKREAS